jgi:hypothetical protein
MNEWMVECCPDDILSFGECLVQSYKRCYIHSSNYGVLMYTVVKMNAVEPHRLQCLPYFL